jgi:hypothetical protein
MSGPRTLGGPWTVDNPLPVTQVAGEPPNVEGWFPPTVDNPLPVYIVTTLTADVAGRGSVAIVEDAPRDGRIYARKDGAWVAIGVQE